MKAGDMVVFRVNGELELKSGKLMSGLFGNLYIVGSDDCVYGFGMLNMIQVYPGEQKTGWRNHNIGNVFGSMFQSGTCRI